MDITEKIDTSSSFVLRRPSEIRMMCIGWFGYSSVLRMYAPQENATRPDGTSWYVQRNGIVRISMVLVYDNGQKVTEIAGSERIAEAQ